MREQASPSPLAPRPHLPVDRDAPLEEFERMALQYPVFRIAVS